MYTANIADTVIFRSLGKELSTHLQALKRAVENADTEMWVPAAVYSHRPGIADSYVASGVSWSMASIQTVSASRSRSSSTGTVASMVTATVATVADSPG
jgi:hypothetical protein